MHDSTELTHEVIKAGARGYILKEDASKHIVRAIETLADHKPYFTWKVSKTMLDAYLRNGDPATGKLSQFNELTSREREIIQLLAEGHSNKAVATRLGISVKTVETHRAAIMRKLSISSIAQMVRYAVRNHIIQP